MFISSTHTPSPLVFLHNYLEESLSTFLLKNIENLKDAGYGILLVEMNDDMTLEMHHQLTQGISSNQGRVSGIGSFLSKDALYTKAQKLGVDVRFIDPEPFMVSTERSAYNQALVVELLATGLSTLQAHTIINTTLSKSTDERDEVMAQRLIRAYRAEKKSGRNRGIIAIAGCMHRHFASIISRHIPDAHVIAFGDKREVSEGMQNCTLIEKNIWEKAILHGNTKDFYSSPVRSINAADYSDEYGFEKFESEFRLRSEVAVERADSSAVMRVLQKVHPEIQFARNDRFVISAEISVADDEARNLLAGNLPLQPTIIEKQSQKTLRFSGINLPPQVQRIASYLG